MTSLMGELRDDIVNDSTSLPTVLRKAKVLAAELGNEDFRAWVHSELNGYSDAQQVPDYRRFRIHSHADLMNPIGSMLRNIAVPDRCIPDVLKDVLSVLVLDQGVRALEGMVADDGKHLQFAWPGDALGILDNQLYEHYSCVSAWRSLPKSYVEQILDTVRNRLLDFVMELGELVPGLADSLDAAKDVAPEKVQMVFNTYVTGDSNVVAAGQDIAQDVEVTGLAAGDLDGLLRFLMDRVGVPQDAADELREAITTDGPSVEAHEPGPSVVEWSAKAMSKLGQGAWQLTTSTGGSLIAQAIAKFYGG